MSDITVSLNKVDKVIAQIRILASKYPNAKYERPKDSMVCLYNRGKVSFGPRSCGCIVGQAVRRVSKVEYDKIKELRCGAQALFRGANINKLNWIREVQIRQDEGCTWGRAVELASIGHLV